MAKECLYTNDQNVSPLVRRGQGRHELWILYKASHSPNVDPLEFQTQDFQRNTEKNENGT